MLRKKELSKNIFLWRINNIVGQLGILHLCNTFQYAIYINMSLTIDLLDRVIILKLHGDQYPESGTDTMMYPKLKKN